jgi:hypothetical protein
MMFPVFYLRRKSAALVVLLPEVLLFALLEI